MSTMSNMRITATHTGATIHTSSIPSDAGATDTSTDDTENDSEYGLDVNF